jgi:hypothetical protein
VRFDVAVACGETLAPNLVETARQQRQQSNVANKWGKQAKRPIDKNLGEQAKRSINKNLGEQAKRSINKKLWNQAKRPIDKNLGEQAKRSINKKAQPNH